MRMQASHETRAKYLSPGLASRYGVAVPGITGPRPAAPPLLGLTMVPVAPPTTGAQDAQR